MVVINTQPNIRVTHFVQIPQSQCFIASCRETTTNKIRLYLLTNSMEHVYSKNGLNDTWNRLTGISQHLVRRVVQQALESGQIPKYSTKSIYSNLN